MEVTSISYQVWKKVRMGRFLAFPRELLERVGREMREIFRAVALDGD